jgi:hypothetical protein
MVAHVNPANDPDQLKINLVLSHEIGRHLGAGDDNSEPVTIMHRNAGAYLTEEPNPVFSEVSQVEMKRCTRRYLRRLRRAQVRR